MFIRFSFPRIFRLRGRSRKESAKTQPAPPDTSATSTPHPTITPERLSTPYPDSDSDDPFVYSPIITIHPSPEFRVESSLSHHSASSTASEMQTPIIIIEDHSTAFELVPTSITLHETQFIEKPRIARAKSTLFSMPAANASAVKLARRATMAAHLTRRNTKRQTKIEFKRNSRRGSQIGIPQVERRVSRRGSKRVSRIDSMREKRLSRWEIEINDTYTREELALY